MRRLTKEFAFSQRHSGVSKTEQMRLNGHMVGTRHTLIDCLLSDQKLSRIPSADLLFCDAILLPRLGADNRKKNIIAYSLISPECLDQIVAMMPIKVKNALDSKQ